MTVEEMVKLRLPEWQALEADVSRLKSQLAELSELQRKITLEPQHDNADLIVP